MSIICGLQTQSVREILRSDPVGTLEKVAEVGYKYIELNDYDVFESSTWYGLKADALAALTERLGLRIIGGYARKINVENAKAVIEYYKALGSEQIIIPLAYFPTVAAIQEKCAAYNRIGEMCLKNGLELYYENHYHEMQIVGGKTVLEQLLAGTDPSNLKLSLNNYWLMRSLVDPLYVLNKYSSRIGSLVLQDYPLSQIDKLNVWSFSRFHPISRNINKDIPLKGGEIENINPVHCELFTEIGSGIFKLQPLIDRANMIENIKYVLLRQDYTTMSSEFDSIKVSFDNCSTMNNVVWE